MFLNNLKMLARNAEQALFIYRFLCMIKICIFRYSSSVMISCCLSI